MIKSNTMSTDPNKIYKNSFHWRNDSGELDVFEAARYFSSSADQAVPAYINGDRHHAARPARRSLDTIMIRSNPIPPAYHHRIIDQKQLMKDQNKKSKQPSSPGGRLASFLNSLFNQTSLKKKKKSKSGAAAKDFEEESPNGRRKRRSSISHFRITTASKAAAEKASGYRTPPPHANTPTKAYKEVGRFAGHDAAAVGEKKGVGSEKNGRKVRLPREKRWSEEEDDGGESDSSSDLFDLPNHDLDFFSSGLPVYETTHIQTITIATGTAT